MGLSPMRALYLALELGLQLALRHRHKVKRRGEGLRHERAGSRSSVNYENRECFRCRCDALNLDGKPSGRLLSHRNGHHHCLAEIDGGNCWVSEGDASKFDRGLGVLPHRFRTLTR